jgi:hypothetical protein
MKRKIVVIKNDNDLPNIEDKEIKIIKPILTQEDVKELFEYKDGDLYWKINIFAGKDNRIHRIKAGDKAGCIYYKLNNKVFYKQVRYKKRAYKISRIIFLMFYGYLPEYIIHKDGDSLNTRIENLLEANSSQIHFKNKFSKRNTTGYTGVSFSKRDKKYISSIRVNNKRVNLGVYNTAEEATKIYEIAKEKYHGDFINKCTNDRS